MSLSRKQIEKRKQREIEVRKKVLDQRAEFRKEKKIAEQERLREKEMYELEHGKISSALPGNPDLAVQKEAERTRKTADKIAKNLELLKKLQEEFEQEQSMRKNFNENLEAEGYETLKEKMNALAEKSTKIKEVAERLAQHEENYAAQHNSDIK
jgi:hypothetical protein